MKVVGYVSSNLTSLELKYLEIKDQIQVIQDFCKREKLELIKIYQEPPESRADYKPAFLKILIDSLTRGFKRVIITDAEILGDNVEMISALIGELKKSNLEIFAQNIDVTDSFDKGKLKAESLKENIKNKVKDIGSLPEVVIKVTELVQDPNSSAAQLSRILSHDPGLTSKVLRLVNSAYYGFPKQISSVQHAVMILGFTTMKGLALSSSIYKIFAPKSGAIVAMDYKKLWKHFLITAIIARKIYKYLYQQDDADIFSAAILHDIGKIILDQYDHSNYINVLHHLKKFPNEHTCVELEEKFCGADHQEIGYLIAENWNLPENLADVIHYHHAPLKSANNTQLVSVVYVADILSNTALGIIEYNIDAFDSEVIDYLGMNQDDIVYLYEEIMAEMDNYKDMESFFK